MRYTQTICLSATVDEIIAYYSRKIKLLCATFKEQISLKHQQQTTSQYFFFKKHRIAVINDKVCLSFPPFKRQAKVNSNWYKVIRGHVFRGWIRAKVIQAEIQSKFTLHFPPNKCPLQLLQHFGRHCTHPSQWNMLEIYQKQGNFVFFHYNYKYWGACKR